MNKQTLINKFSQALQNDCGAIFVGSGISFPSTKIDWFKLLEPLINEIDIKIDNEKDDLPQIAQYIVNNYSGNRGPLINEIAKAFSRKFSINKYHRYLSTTKVSTIWTTNYDTLLERAFSDFHLDVKVNDDAISRNVMDSEIEIIKMHGCMAGSRHEEIVIAQEDYEDFSIKKPAISGRLSNDLLKKSFLFIGYSYRDPNIKNIMIKARRLCNKSTQQHYLILTKPKKYNNEDESMYNDKLNRQKLWCDDLKRLGISTLLIDKHSELEEILELISQKSRGKTVYVTGSHEKTNETSRQLGAKLADEKDIILVSGQSSGIGANVVSAFIEQCIIEKYDINNRVKIFPNPYAANEKYSNDPKLLGELKKYRAKLFNSTQVVVVFNGGMGTEAEVEVALNQNCKIIPIILTAEDRNSDVMKKILKNELVMDQIQKLDKEYYDKIIKNEVTVEDIYRCLIKLLD